MRIIILTGIPGTGKTTIGNYLKDYYGYSHIDLENPEKNSSSEYLCYSQNNFDPDLLFKKLKKEGKDTVITWGFYPLVHDHKLLRLQALGATLFWLDGDRELAREAWRNREEPIPDDLFDAQIEKINNHDIQGIFSPINLDTFNNEEKKHRNLEEIVKDIFEKS
jgi:gluconate kinase